MSDEETERDLDLQAMSGGDEAAYAALDRVADEYDQMAAAAEAAAEAVNSARSEVEAAADAAAEAIDSARSAEEPSLRSAASSLSLSEEYEAAQRSANASPSPEEAAMQLHQERPASAFEEEEATEARPLAAPTLVPPAAFDAPTTTGPGESKLAQCLMLVGTLSVAEKRALVAKLHEMLECDELHQLFTRTGK